MNCRNGLKSALSKTNKALSAAYLLIKFDIINFYFSTTNFYFTITKTKHVPLNFIVSIANILLTSLLLGVLYEVKGIYIYTYIILCFLQIHHAYTIKHCAKHK